MSDARFQHGPVHILDEIICEPVPDLQVWRSPDPPQTSKESHEVVIDGQSALELSRRLAFAGGKPIARIDVADGIGLIPYYHAISQSDQSCDAAMIACSLTISPGVPLRVAASELIQWAKQNCVDEMILDGVLWSASGDVDKFVSEWERFLRQ